MKVAVITRHAISNYGSFLQTYALQQVLEKLGNKVEIIDYIRYDEESKNLPKTLVKKSKKWNRNFLTRSIYYVLQVPEYIFMGMKFKKFRKDKLSLSKVVSRTNKDLTAIEADVFCTGSDQVWGTIGTQDMDKSYFLNFVDENKRKISYAASFGKSELDRKNTYTIKEHLNRYEFISVREDSAKKVLENWGIEKVDQVLDPTLLMDTQEWEKLIDEDISGDYILIYQLHNNPQMDEYAKRVAEQKKMPLIRISALLHQIFRSGKFIYLPDYSKWLAYIKNANLLITDSFHGTVFAINFKTQFLNVNPGMTVTRNTSILELTGLQSRMVTSYDDFAILDEWIDYEPVSNIICKERVKSINWLENAIKSIG